MRKPNLFRENRFLSIPLNQDAQRELNESWKAFERRIAKNAPGFQKKEIFVVDEKGVTTRVKVAPRELRQGKFRKSYPTEFTSQALERLERIRQRKSRKIETQVRKLRKKLEAENPRFKRLMNAVSALQEEINNKSTQKHIRVDVEKTLKGLKISITLFTTDIRLILRDLEQQIDVCKKIIELSVLERSATYLIKRLAKEEGFPKTVIDRIEGTLNFLSRKKSELDVQIHQFEVVKRRLEQSI